MGLWWLYKGFMEVMVVMVALEGVRGYDGDGGLRWD